MNQSRQQSDPDREPPPLWRWLAALSIPVVAAAIHWQLWPLIRPFAWFLFYPAVFFAAAVDGRRGAITASIVSILLAMFVPPQLTWQADNAGAWFTVGIFFLMSVAFGETFERLRRVAGARIASIRVQHEAEMERQGETQFRQIVEGLPQLVWATTPAGVCDYLSRQWLDYTGVPLDQQLGQGWLAAVHPDDRALLWDAWSTALRDGAPYRVEHRLQRADGAYRWFDTRAIPLRDERGGIVRWFGTSTDIQSTRDATSQLERQARLLEIAYDPIILWSEDRGIEFWNEGAAQLYGFGADEALGKVSHDLLQTVFPVSLADMLETLHTHGVWSGELRHVTRSGAPVIVTSRLQQLEYDGRRVVLEANRDITKERAQLEEVRRWADAFTYCTHGIGIGLPRSNTILACNPAYAAMLGKTSDEIAGQPILSVYAESDREMVRASIERADRFGHVRFEAHLAREDGHAVPVQVDIATVRNTAGEVTYRVATIQDIRERREAEEQVRRLTVGLEQQVATRTVELRAANAELESFAYAVSHDLRAPLRAMSGFSTALIEDYGSKLDGEALTYLEQIILGARQMGNLIDGLLVLSRSTRGELTVEPVDLTAMARRLWEQICQGERTGSPRAVDFDVEPGMVAHGDPRMLEVVVRNLLDNAWKYTSRTEHPRVRICKVEGRQGTFAVTDNGAGFDEAHAGKLFQPFQRLHRQEEFAGTGIGLATVQRIVRRHGGELQAHGAVGRGATFTFSLPAPAREAAA